MHASSFAELCSEARDLLGTTTVLCEDAMNISGFDTASGEFASARSVIGVLKTSLVPKAEEMARVALESLQKYKAEGQELHTPIHHLAGHATDWAKVQEVVDDKEYKKMERRLEGRSFARSECAALKTLLQETLETINSLQLMIVQVILHRGCHR